jgi:hypothetical protein
VAVGALIVVLAVGGYVAARNTSLFAVQSIDVRGGNPLVRAQVAAALRPLDGRSLLRIDGDVIENRLAPLPAVASFRYDRAFPHTLRVVVRAERPVLVLRTGSRAFLVSSTGRVLRQLSRPRSSALPRLWLPPSVRVSVGGVAPLAVRIAAAGVAPVTRALLPRPVQTVVASRTALTLQLVGGFELRLGDVGDLRLKLAIARRILAQTRAAGAPGYLDVSVPERPVLASNSQVGG